MIKQQSVAVFVAPHCNCVPGSLNRIFKTNSLLYFLPVKILITLIAF